MQHLKIRNLGPIKHCEIHVDDFTVLTGPQASGKSTIARSIYFFRTLKDDVFAQITHRPSEDEYETDTIRAFEKRLKKKFLQIFGSTWSMVDDMKLTYKYAPHVKISLMNGIKKSAGRRCAQISISFSRITMRPSIFPRAEV